MLKSVAAFVFCCVYFLLCQSRLSE